jgi:hypothetical protein
VFLEHGLFLTGPLTFGVSYWLAYVLRITFYHQLCGTGAQAINQGP